MGLRSRAPGLFSALALPWLLAAGCGGETAPPDVRELSVETVLARDRAAAFFAAGRWEDAARTLAPLVAAEDAPREDLLRAANVELARGRVADATGLVERARALPGAGDDPSLQWALFRLARSGGAVRDARRFAAAVHRLAPKDAPAELALADLLV